MQAAQFEARQFEYASLAQIHSWSDAPRDRPLFETLLAFENFPIDPGSHEAAEALQVRYWGRTNYPLSLMVLPAATGCCVGPSSTVQRFTSEAIDRLLGHFAELLAGFVENPTRSLSAIPLLTAPERAQLATWNAVSSAYPREATVHELFEEQARLRPDAVAISGSGPDVTYAQLNARANRLAARLRLAAVAPETVVAVCTRATVDLVAGMLGVLKAGGAYLPLESRLPRRAARLHARGFRRRRHRHLGRGRRGGLGRCPAPAHRRRRCGVRGRGRSRVGGERPETWPT